jgi:kynurenine formamidase
MSCKFLKVQASVVAAVLSIAMLLFAAQRHDNGSGPQFHTVIDLTTAAGSPASSRTTLLAPSQLGGAWTVESLPPTRLIAPLAVIEAGHKNFPESESLVTMDDVAAYERVHGAVPQGSIVLLASNKPGINPVFSHDALHFLMEARDVVAIGGGGTHLVDASEDSYLGQKGAYEIENIANISVLPKSGMIGVAAPDKLPDAGEAPVRLMALVK